MSTKLPILQRKNVMKIIIEDECFSYQVDWSKQDKIEDGFLEEYRPDIEDVFESFLHLLENIFSEEKSPPTSSREYLIKPYDLI